MAPKRPVDSGNMFTSTWGSARGLAEALLARVSLNLDECVYLGVHVFGGIKGKQKEHTSKFSRSGRIQSSTKICIELNEVMLQRGLPSGRCPDAFYTLPPNKQGGHSKETPLQQQYLAYGLKIGFEHPGIWERRQC